MSLTYNITDADDVPLDTCHPHDVGDTTAGPDTVALVIGDPSSSARAVMGTLAELRIFAQRVAAQVDALEYGLPEPEDDD